MSETFISLENMYRYTKDLFDNLFNVGKNKLNPESLHQGYINTTNEIYPNATNYKYLFLPVKIGDVINANFSMRFANQYNENREFISSFGQYVNNITATANGYISISIANVNWYHAMIMVNESAPSYFIEYQRTYKYLILDKSSILNGSIEPEKVSFLESTGNLFNKDELVANKYNGGTAISDSTDYSYSGYIPVEYGKIYTFSTAVRSVIGFDENKNYLLAVSSNETSSVTISNGSCAFILVNVYNSTYNEDAFMIVEGATLPDEYVPYGYKLGSIIIQEGIEDGSITPAKTSFLEQTLNLFDKRKTKVGIFTTDDGTEVSFADYNSSGLIPVESGKTYTLSKEVRSVVKYNSSGAPMNSYYSQQTSSVTANWNGFMLLNMFASTYSDEFMVVEGSTLPDYFIPHGYKFTNDIIVDTNIDKKKISITKGDNSISVSSKLKDGSIHTSNCLISAGGNNLFNFYEELIKNDGNTYKKSADDDITPFRLNNTTIGANHGYPFLNWITNTDKTEEDIGSTWKDSNDRVFTLFAIDNTNNRVGFIPDTYTLGGGTINVADYHTPSGTLTHYQNATNTDSISVANLSTVQFYPSVKNIDRKILIDNDVDITLKEGSFETNEINVCETYEIVDYGSILQYMQQHIGETYNVDNYESCARVSTNYKFIGEGKCVVSVTLTALKNLWLSSCGLVQAQAILPSTGQTLYYYMGNVAEKSGINLSNKVAASSLSSGIVIGKSDLTDNTIPPNKLVGLLLDASNNRLFGFALGYIIDKSMSSNANRLTHSTNDLMEIRASTLKMYPSAYQLFDANETYANLMPQGKVWNGLAFRVVLGQENQKATSIFDVKIGNDYYVYIDYNQSVSLETYQLRECIGSKIEILQSNDNFELLSDMVDNSGINFNINGSYGWAVLKVHK